MNKTTIKEIQSIARKVVVEAAIEFAREDINRQVKEIPDYLVISIINNTYDKICATRDEITTTEVADLVVEQLPKLNQKFSRVVDLLQRIDQSR